jgi:hypothetical protein
LKVLEEIELNADVASASDRRRVFRGQALAARTLRDWEKLGIAVEKWSREHSKLGTSITHTGIELLGFEAQHRAAFGRLPESIIECVKSENASTYHRLSAATLAMISADNNGDSATAKTLFSCVSGLTPRTKPERLAWLTTTAVYSASFGDLERITDLLSQLVQEALTISQPALRAYHIRRACFGISRYGDRELAETLLRQSLETFERLCIPAEQAPCVEELGILALRSNRIDEAVRWIEKANALYNEWGQPFARAVEFELRLLRAYQTQDRSFLPDFPFPTEVGSALSQSRRGRMTVLAMWIIHAVMSHNVGQIHEQLQELGQLLAEMRGRPEQDVAVAALAHGLVETGDHASASRILKDYLGASRRGPSPIPCFLRRLQSSPGVHEVVKSA